MVSGYEGRFGSRYFPCKQIRTTIPASPGDGGSVYIDLQGRILGMQVSSVPDIRATYVLPGRATLRLRDDLLFSGAVQYAWLGFEVREDASRAQGPTLVLSKVMADGPSAQAGLLSEDQLIGVGEFEIHRLDDLRNALFYTRPGQMVAVKVLRDGQLRNVNIKVAVRPPDEPFDVLRSEAAPAADLPVVNPPRARLAAPKANLPES